MSRMSFLHIRYKCTPAELLAGLVSLIVEEASFLFIMFNFCYNLKKPILFNLKRTLAFKCLNIFIIRA